MKESKFIELLNLYVDHEINAAEAAELEAEIQQNPQRREVYHQYCRIQKGCTVLADQFRTEAPQPAASPAHARRRSPAWAYAGGLLAAAACAAFVVTTKLHQATAPQALSPARTSGNALASALPAAPAASVAVMQKPAALPTAHMDFQPVLVSHTLHLANLAADTDSTMLTARDQAKLDWLQNIQLSPLRVPAENLRFDTQTSSGADNRVYAGRKPIGTAEMTAFQFQR
ncbi:hypothetical protein K0B96_08350 [Horticoccus luteus]|uniref:Uncharacterized protein n=1 Tax=Horticoccus luteus TaxID=2862869 RepID=A0A8F9TZX7_9BACT|nr:hypothetical protein [Horticoccus luteus]QYM80597.1 hypothetical protein K0B96_08350 [Horticoccus luteus]